MKRLLANRWLRAAARILLGAMFLYAGSVSIRSPQDFADSVAAYQLVPGPLINTVALTIPPLEIIIGTLLIVGWPRRLVAFAGLALMVIYLVALSSALARGLVIDCGCFGHGAPSRMKMWVSFGRDVLFAVVLLGLYAVEEKKTAEATVIRDS